MPPKGVCRSPFVCFCFAAILALCAPGSAVEAASSAALDPEQAREAALSIDSMPESEVSLTGFHCGGAAEQASAAFAADPDYSETPSTIGLEFAFEDGGMPVSGGRVSGEEGDVRSPLSARLSRISLEGGTPSLMDVRQMEEVSLPEASMSVADMMDICLP